MGRVERLLAGLATTVAATGCPLPPVGDPGIPFYELSVRLQDETGVEVAASAWTTPRGLHPVVTQQRSSFDRDTFEIYEGPPNDAFIGGVARLDFFYGSEEDLGVFFVDDPVNEPDNNDDVAARARIAVTRTTLWCSDTSWREVDADAVPFDLAVLDDDDVFSAEFARRDRAIVLFVDSAIPAARRCGDDVQAACDLECDIVTGVGAAPCCAQAHEALLACDALIASDSGTARLQRPL